MKRIDKFILFISSKIKWKLSNKIAFLIAIMLIALLINGMFSIFMMNWTSETINYNFETSVKRNTIASDLNDSVMQFDRLIVEHTRARYIATRNDVESDLIVLNEEVTKLIEDYRETEIDERNIELIEAFDDKWKDYYTTTQIVIEISRTGDTNRAIEFWDGWPSIRYTELKDIIKNMTDYNSKLIQDSMEDVNNASKKTTINVICVTAATFIISILLGLFIVRYIQITIKKAIEFNENLIKGDFSNDLDQEYYGEMGVLFKSNNKVALSLQNMVMEVKEITSKLTTASIEYKTNIAEKEKHKAVEGIIALDEASNLMQTFIESLEKVNLKINEVMLSTGNQEKMEFAHSETVNILVKINREILKMEKFLKDIDNYSDKINGFIQYIKVADFNSLNETDKRLEFDVKKTFDTLDRIVNTVEIIKYGLLDQKINMNIKFKTASDPEVNTYFEKITELIYEVLKKCEGVLFAAKRVSSEIGEAIKSSQEIYSRTDLDRNSEFVLLLNDLQNKINTFKL